MQGRDKAVFPPLEGALLSPLSSGKTVSQVIGLELQS